MEIAFKLSLPRDEISVPVVRHISRDALLKLGVQPDCVSDIELAVTEACTNVLHHADNTDDIYEVSFEVNERRAEIRVVDTGRGFEEGDIALSEDSAESGRGIFLMKALVDDLKFVSEPEKGTVVHLVKHLVVEEGSLLHVLAKDGVRTAPPAGVAALDGS
jgi:serine/threonine-protein kinase RsbW